MMGWQDLPVPCLNTGIYRAGVAHQKWMGEMCARFFEAALEQNQQGTEELECQLLEIAWSIESDLKWPGKEELAEWGWA